LIEYVDAHTIIHLKKKTAEGNLHVYIAKKNPYFCILKSRDFSCFQVSHITQFMESDKTKYAMQYGLYLGLYIGARFFMGVSHNILFTLLAFFMWLGIPLLLYYIIKNYRDSHLNGLITYKSALGRGCSLFFFSGLIVELIQFTYFQFINKEYLGKMWEVTKELYSKFNFEQQSYDMMEKIMQPHMYVLSDFLVSFLLGGTIISLIIAAVVQRKPNPFQ
jgi:hypothetical protein